MTDFDTRFLLPDEDEAPLPPYPKVWRPAAREALLLVILALVINIGAGVAGVDVPAGQRSLVTTVIALLPLGLWFLFTWRAQRRVQFPYRGLLGVLGFGFLVANAVVLPFIEVFVAPGVWLNSVSGLTRIFGYMLTVGIVTEFFKYLVLRYMVWRRYLERRIDIVPYSLAVSLAFATVANLRFALLVGGGQPGAAAIHVASMVLAQQGIGLLLAYGLMVLRFGNPGVLFLALMLFGGAGLHGFYNAVRAGFVVGAFGIGATANQPLVGLIFSAAFGLIMYGVFAFLIASADARDVRMSELR